MNINTILQSKFSEYLKLKYNIDFKDFEIQLTKKDFEVTIDGDILHVNGEKSKESEEKEEGYTCKEFSYNSFKRSLKLPNTIKKDQDIKATYKNGILKLKTDIQKFNFINKFLKSAIPIITDLINSAYSDIREGESFSINAPLRDLQINRTKGWLSTCLPPLPIFDILTGHERRST